MQSQPSVIAYRINNIHIEIPLNEHDYIRCFFNEPSPFIYIVSGLVLYTFDTITMQFLPALKVVGIDFIDNIAGVYNGVITVKANKCCVATAQLPKCYFDLAEPVLEVNAPIFTEKIDKNTTKSNSELQTTTEAFDDLFEHCSCSICSETFDSVKFIPRVLDCGHTFCEVCLLNKKLCNDNQIKCPNCSKIHKLSKEKEPPINYFAISMTEQTMKSRIDSRIACASCSQFEQLICMGCALDGGHGGHVVKYDVKLEKIRGELREKVTNLCTTVEEKQHIVLKKADRVANMIESVKTNITKVAIPTAVIDQLDTLASEQDAIDYEEIVKDLSETILNQCNTLTEAFDHTLNAAKGLELFDDRIEDREAINAELILL